jgi:hypothetical protein
MPSVSKSQQRLFGAAEHGATFPLAEKLRSTMSHQQLHDFAATKTAGLPNRVATPRLSTLGAPAAVAAPVVRKNNLGVYLHDRKKGR